METSCYLLFNNYNIEKKSCQGGMWSLWLANSAIASSDTPKHIPSTSPSTVVSEKQRKSQKDFPTLTPQSPTWKAIYKLQFGARPEKRNRKEWICSLECKKNNNIITFKDAQATEKHIMREHPDPEYDKFVCLKAGCRKEKVSPQQILDHLSQKLDHGGHSITLKSEKDEHVRTVKRSTGEHFR